MIKKLFIVLLLAAPCFATQRYGYTDPKIDDEFQNNYKEHKYPNWINAKGSSATITYVSVSTLTVNGVNYSTSTGVSTAGSTLGQVLVSSGATNPKYFAYQGPVQVVAYTVTAGSGTTTSAYATTNLSGAIVPHSSSNRVMIQMSGRCQMGTNNVDVFVTLGRGSPATNLLSSNGCSNYNSASAMETGCSCTYIDSPATTSSTNYAVMIKSNGVATATFCGTNMTCSMILTELGPNP